MSKTKFDDYIKTRSAENNAETESDFDALCEEVKRIFLKDWENRENSGVTFEIQKRAIIGYEKEKNFFKTRIEEILRQIGALNRDYPSWYENLIDAIYHENWGLSGLSEWFTKDYENSSSAKIIGDRIYFLDQGKMRLMPQHIQEQRKQQLIRAFMLLSPKERFDKPYYELYMLDGTRITIYIEPMAKSKQSCIVFRRYILPNYSFEEQARRHTIPKEIIPFFRAMVGIGFNVVFMGAVRTAKTTFLSTWQSYEDQSLEGVMVETDPEIPLHRILPKAPILQLIADGEELKKISKNLLRSDADYFIMAEARDGNALDVSLRIACKGTKRMKMTYHSRNPYQFTLEAAMEIVQSNGGDIALTRAKIASSFDYIFHFVQLPDKRQKRLKGIYELSLDENGKERMMEILSYDYASDNWIFTKHLGEDKKIYAMEGDLEVYKTFEEEMERLSEIRVLC